MSHETIQGSLVLTQVEGVSRPLPLNYIKILDLKPKHVESEFVAGSVGPLVWVTMPSAPGVVVATKTFAGCCVYF